MARPKILVTGATGKTGAAVVAHLREQDWPVRAVVRTLDARSEPLRRLGAEVVVADLFDPQALLEAMRGTTRAYYCPPFHPSMIHGAAAFAVAARAARLESIVVLSQWLAQPAHPSLATRQHWLADRLFALLPETTLTILNPGYFADSYLLTIAYAAQFGIFPLPIDGESRNAPPSNEDIARVAAAVLADPEPHAGRTYRPTGPELLRVTDMARIVGEVLGRRVRHVRLPMWLYVRAARLDGAPPIMLAGLPSYVADHQEGTFAVHAPTDDVLRATGRRAEDFATIARRYAARPQARRTPGAMLRTLGTFLTVPLVPGLDPARYARRHEHPLPAAPRLSAESALWRAEHAPPPSVIAV